MPEPRRWVLDFETRSRAKLKEVGGRRYAEHPETEMVCGVAYEVRPDGEAKIWLPGDEPLRFDEGDEVWGHNVMGFDRFITDRFWGGGINWRDSIHLARRSGMPGALDALGARWYGAGKDAPGRRKMLALSQPSRAKATKGQLPELTFERILPVLDYCAQDVDINTNALPRLLEYTGFDEDVLEVHQTINDRGIPFDSELATAMLKLIDIHRQEACEQGAREWGGGDADEVRTVCMSPEQFTAETGLPNAQKETVAEALQDMHCHPLVKVRAALASILPGKLRAGLARVCPDGFMRDTHMYYGAGTGRWSSKGLQFQNLPRGGVEALAEDLGISENACMVELCDAILAGEYLTPSELESAFRGIVCAPAGYELIAQDFVGIEARVLQWWAGDAEALAVFRAQDAGTGPDPYRVMASKIFATDPFQISSGQRKLGKFLVLGCGYGLGHKKFATMVPAGLLEAHDLTAKQAVDAWRKANRKVVRLWDDCHNAFADACNGKTTNVGPVQFQPGPYGSIEVWLPSGRPIVYQEARTKRVKKWGRWTWDNSYFGSKAWRESAYGGKVVENVVQAMSRDLLADAMVRLESDGLPLVMTVHDEAVGLVRRDEAPDATDHMRHVMTTLPDWAAGIPINVDGFRGVRYRK